MIGPTVEETEDFIIQAHGQQTRRGDETPYHTHPQAVAKIALEILTKNLDAEEDDAEFIVKLALLHDVIEDTQVTIEMIGKMGYPIKLLNSLELLTKYDDEFGKETHDEAITRIIESGDLPAIIVKLADTEHNSLVNASDISWMLSRGEDPSIQTARYIRSHKRLLESPAFIAFSGR